MGKKPTGWAPPPGYVVLTRWWDGAKVLVAIDPRGAKK